MYGVDRITGLDCCSARGFQRRPSARFQLAVRTDGNKRNGFFVIVAHFSLLDYTDWSRCQIIRARALVRLVRGCCRRLHYCRGSLPDSAFWVHLDFLGGYSCPTYCFHTLGLLWPVAKTSGTGQLLSNHSYSLNYRCCLACR